MSNNNNQKILREVGEHATIVDGLDYKSPNVRIVPNTHKDAGEDDRAIYISQRDGGVSLSIETLQCILNWASGQDKKE